jgi:segregation and condensation protein A
VPYQVATPVFEGPFDLLLHLITKEQVDIYEVNLSVIVDAYLQELERMQDLDLEVATEFLLIAAILVELKTRRLLPGRDDVDLDEEFGLWEERDLLLARLLECQTFKQAAHELELLADRAARSFPRRAGLEEPFLALAPDLLAGVTAAKLRAAYLRAVAPKPPPPTVDTDHVAPIRISVQEVVEGLAARLPALGRTTFLHLTADAPDRLTVIASFLGVLELVKQGLVDLEQASTFGELEVIWIGAEGAALDAMAVEDYAG